MFCAKFYQIRWFDFDNILGLQFSIFTYRGFIITPFNSSSSGLVFNIWNHLKQCFVETDLQILENLLIYSCLEFERNDYLGL